MEQDKRRAERVAQMRARRRPRANKLATAQPAAPAAPVERRRSHRPAAIDVRDVHKTYQMGNVSVAALRGVSLQVKHGEYVALMGASGSGKTTLMNILGCLDVPTSGIYRLNGLDVQGMDEDTLSEVRNRFIGFVFQSFNLLPRTRAAANVELPLTYLGMPRKERRQRAVAALEAVGLGTRIHHTPSELSGGQQQRVAIARALVTNPAMILADEPTGNLDTASGAEVLGIFERLSDTGRTIILITHEETVAAHARRVIRISDGLIVGDTAGTAETEPRR